MPTFGSLFAGIGGIDLGLERAGWTGRWQVEWDEWCRARLADRWPDVPRHGDITDVDFGAVEPVDLLAGGFPCQPVSAAGHQKAQEDARWLWPEFHRAIRDLRPGLVLVENVPNLLAINRGSAFGDVLGDLAASGYDTEWDCIPAAAVGAPHERDRVFLVAYPEREGSQGRAGSGFTGAWRASVEPARESEGLADAASDRRAVGRISDQGRDADPSDGQRVRSQSGRAGADAGTLAYPDSPRLEGRVFHPERGSQWFAGPSGLGDPERGGRIGRASDSGRGTVERAAAGRSGTTGRRREDGLPESRLGRAADGFPHGLDHCWPAPPGPQYDWEPPRTVTGRIPDRTKRLKACGNAVVPQVVELISRWLRAA